MSPYEILSVGKDANPEEIKRAYRSAAAKHHPDRKNGDTETFQQIQVAYDILSDDERRKRYDATGDVKTEPDLRQQAMQQLAGMMLGIVDQADIVHIDVIEVLRENIQQGIERHKQQIAAVEAKIKKRETAIERLTFVSAGDNFMLSMLDGDIRMQRQVIENTHKGIALGEEMLNIIAEYSYRVDVQMQRPSYHDQFAQAQTQQSWFNR